MPETITAPTRTTVAPRPRNVGLGLRLSPSALRELARHRLRLHTHVAVGFQQRASRWVITAEEAGGAVAELGHYVGYSAVAPNELISDRPLMALNPNDSHRAIAALDLLRYEIFRMGELCNLAVTRFSLEPSPTGTRPLLRSRVIFSGENGALSKGMTHPVFFSRTGEEVGLSRALLPGIEAASAGVLCIHCRHAHFAKVPAAVLKLS